MVTSSAYTNLECRTVKVTSKSTKSRSAYLISWVHTLKKLNLKVNDVTHLLSRSSSLNATRLEQNLVMADSLNEKSSKVKLDLFLKLRRNNGYGAFVQI